MMRHDGRAATTAEPSPAPYPHWMLREIYEQPDALAATLALYVEGHSLRTDACVGLRSWLHTAVECGIVIAASGSSRHTGMVAEVLIEDLSGIAVDVEYASEYTYRAERGLKDAAVLVVSQSGETADTLAALRKAKSSGHRTLAVTNVPGSTMAAEADISFPMAAGPERAIPATKSFTCQLLNLYLLALLAGEVRSAVPLQELRTRLVELSELPALVRRQLPAWDADARKLAAAYQNAQSFLFLGRGLHYPIAREGALKLKESAYVHAEGYPSGELKHGPNALVQPDTPLVMLATRDPNDTGSVERYERVLHLMAEMRQQGAAIIAVANHGDNEVVAVANSVLFVERAAEPLQAMTEVVPLQLFAYWMAERHGVNVDRPRNLSKAVLAE